MPQYENDNNSDQIENQQQSPEINNPEIVNPEIDNDKILLEKFTNLLNQLENIDIIDL